MTGTFDTTDSSAEPNRATDRAFELASVVVEYDGAPDRCTIYPEEADRLERMATWITADADCFVGLEERR